MEIVFKNCSFDRSNVDAKRNLLHPYRRIGICHWWLVNFFKVSGVIICWGEAGIRLNIGGIWSEFWWAGGETAADAE
jgi:hypothetical protein